MQKRLILLYQSLIIYKHLSPRQGQKYTTHCWCTRLFKWAWGVFANNLPCFECLQHWHDKKPTAAEMTAHNRNGKVREVLVHGNLFAMPSKISVATLNPTPKTETKPMPEMFNLWSGDNLASTDISLTSHLYDRWTIGIHQAFGCIIFSYYSSSGTISSSSSKS